MFHLNLPDIHVREEKEEHQRTECQPTVNHAIEFKFVQDNENNSHHNYN